MSSSKPHPPPSGLDSQRWLVFRGDTKCGDVDVAKVGPPTQQCNANFGSYDPIDQLIDQSKWPGWAFILKFILQHSL